MSAVSVRLIDAGRAQDIRLPNEPFPLTGRMIPGYSGGRWRYDVERFDAGEMCFPDEAYDFDRMSKDSVFIGAYDGDRCIGLAVLRQGFFKYMYLLDLKVCRAYRGAGAGRLMIEKAKAVAAQAGHRGIYTQAQDNNLAACLFYIRCGFRIGGLDTEVYRGTAQEGKADILFYLDC